MRMGVKQAKGKRPAGTAALAGQQRRRLAALAATDMCRRLDGDVSRTCPAGQEEEGEANAQASNPEKPVCSPGITAHAEATAEPRASRVPSASLSPCVAPRRAWPRNPFPFAADKSRPRGVRTLHSSDSKLPCGTDLHLLHESRGGAGVWSRWGLPFCVALRRASETGERKGGRGGR